MADLKTAIAMSTEGAITVRGYDLVTEIMGHRSLTELLYLLVTKRWPVPEETRLLDACLVALSEHGMTPSAIVARIIADGMPGEAQAAIAAGSLAVGSVFAGTMDGCARILMDGHDAADSVAYCQNVIKEHRVQRRALPGFGHSFHKPDDPRARRLLELAAELGRRGRYVGLLETLSEEMDRALGRHLTINITGAIAAVLLEIGVPAIIARGIAVVSRSAGLCSHLVENAETGSGTAIYNLVSDRFLYEPV